MSEPSPAASWREVEERCIATLPMPSERDGPLQRRTLSAATEALHYLRKVGEWAEALEEENQNLRDLLSTEEDP